jgi:hyaluronoglucosaminidase
VNSRFAIRGVIEGFYGQPWSHQVRLDMLAFLGDTGFNAFFYSPKDDPHLRARWREPYGEKALARLRELVDAAGRHGLDFFYGISPGLTMRYSSGADLDALLAKLDQVRALGVTRFGLLLDDIPPRLAHPADRDAFADLVDAHVHVTNAVHAALAGRDADTTLVVCPTVYWGTGEEEYLRRLGRGLPAAVDIFWTGPAICSPRLTAADAATFARTALRPPLYWDNYPVNDVAMTHELHIGPYRGREDILHRFSAGVFANGMTHPEASKIAFATIGDYLSDPAGYDPERSWLAAITRVAGEADAPAVRHFADNVRTSCLSADDADELAEVLDAYRFELLFGDPAAAHARLAAHAAAMQATARQLLDGMHNHALRVDLDRWLRKYARGADALAAVARAADDAERSALAARLRGELDADRTRVFGDVLDMFLAELAQEAEPDEADHTTHPTGDPPPGTPEE